MDPSTDETAGIPPLTRFPHMPFSDDHTSETILTYEGIAEYYSTIEDDPTSGLRFDSFSADRTRTIEYSNLDAAQASMPMP